jgi:hypothetical protein
MHLRFEWSTCIVASMLALTSCSQSPEDGFGVSAGTATATDETGDAASDGSGSNDEGGQTTDSDTNGGDPLFDVGQDGGPNACKVDDDGMDGYGPCEETAPPDSFDPAVQWTWEGDGKWDRVDVTPLVANMSDDNQDGEIDLCDVPDVIVTAWGGQGGGHIYVLDGETGQVIAQSQEFVGIYDNAALADIDGDGVSEVITTLLDVTETNPPGSRIMALEHDMSVKWVSDERWQYDWSQNPGIYQGGAIAVADLDNDDDVEILVHTFVLDHEGELVFHAPIPDSRFVAPTAADLDDDGDLEVLFGPSVFHHDGTEYFDHGGVGFAAVGDVDGDQLPEVILTTSYGITLIEHDGQVTYEDVTPTGDSSGSQSTNLNWVRPATVHDFDGDGESEFAMSSANHYTVYEGGGAIVWSAEVADLTGGAAGTAFDFLGDATAEAMYADETTLFVFDDVGQPLLEVDRASPTLIEYPVVADVDNDGSAEIVVVSDTGFANGANSPPVQVIRDAEDRWVPARRIWNEHTYHVTNVREDGTVPQFEKPHWKELNTFRTQAQLEDGGVCKPDPQG